MVFVSVFEPILFKSLWYNEQSPENSEEHWKSVPYPGPPFAIKNWLSVNKFLNMSNFNIFSVK